MKRCYAAINFRYVDSYTTVILHLAQISSKNMQIFHNHRWTTQVNIFRWYTRKLVYLDARFINRMLIDDNHQPNQFAFYYRTHTHTHAQFHVIQKSSAFPTHTKWQSFSMAAPDRFYSIRGEMMLGACQHKTIRSCFFFFARHKSKALALNK